jgi:hypothetical protein
MAGFDAVFTTVFTDAVFTNVFTNVVIATSTPPQGCMLSFLPFSHFN